MAKTPTNAPTKLQRIEIAAQAFVGGASQSDAYRKAYPRSKNWKADAVHINASKLFADAKVRQRVAELQAATAKRHEATADRVVEELAKLAFSNMQDYITVGEGGEVCVDLTALTRDQAASITEVNTDEITRGTGENEYTTKKTKLKLSDKKGPLELLGRHFGIFNDKMTHQFDFSSLTDEQLQAIVAGRA